MDRKVADRHAAPRKPRWKKIRTPLFLVVLGIVIAFPLIGLSYNVMVNTSTPEFCASCHEIKPAVVAWRSSTHANNGTGVVVDCMDCHLPPPENTFEFFFSKSYHGIKDYIKHYTIDSYDREKNRQATYDALNNEMCQKCHRNLLSMPYKRGAMLAHRTVLYARPGYEKKCVDCHYDLVHSERGLVMFRQARQVPYQAKGLKGL